MYSVSYTHLDVYKRQHIHYYKDVFVILMLKPYIYFIFRDDHVGDYYCVVSHSVNGEICSKLSNTVIADIMPEAPTLIDDLPRQVTVPQEECVILTVNATGRPPPIFQWVMNNSILDNETSNSLRVFCVFITFLYLKCVFLNAEKNN